MTSPNIQRALVSVSDKLGIAGFAQGLVARGVEIFSTGGTRKFLEGEGVQVQDIAAYTGFPEMLEGRVKTLHPKVHGGILARRDRPDDLKALAEHGIVPFEIVVVNLYPFEATIARQGTSYEEAIEQIDIGGPSLIRAAAKNHAFVTVVTDLEQYEDVLEEIAHTGSTSFELRRKLAEAAFALTAAYDQAIAAYLAKQIAPEEFPVSWPVTLVRKASLRYGENPHQKAALYSQPQAGGANLVSALQLTGKEISFNNMLDLDAALGLVRTFAEPAAVVIKHTNPCGVAEAICLEAAAARALAGDPVSAFGSVLGFNRPVNVPTAVVLAGPQFFIEAIVAPDFEHDALEILTTQPKWKANVRLMKVGPLDQPPADWQLRQIDGGVLVQQTDVAPDDENAWQVVTRQHPSDEQLRDLRFAWNVARHVKSNAIVLAKEQMVVGVGAGQMSRLDSVEIAIKKAGERTRGAVLASDAFFPFPDSIHAAAAAGVSAIIQPGGSRRDDEVTAAANEHNLPMIFTGRRHFKH